MCCRTVKQSQLRDPRHATSAITYLSCSPCVCDGVLWSSRTLSDRDDTILIIGVVLSDAMPVDAGTILGVDQVVSNVYCDCVTPVCEQSRPRDGAKRPSACSELGVPRGLPIHSHCRA